MLIVQYPMQFSGPPRNHVQNGFAQANDPSTNTTRVHTFHALL